MLIKGKLYCCLSFVAALLIDQSTSRVITFALLLIWRRLDLWLDRSSGYLGVSKHQLLRQIICTIEIRLLHSRTPRSSIPCVPRNQNDYMHHWDSSSSIRLIARASIEVLSGSCSDSPAKIHPRRNEAVTLDAYMNSRDNLLSLELQ